MRTRRLFNVIVVLGASITGGCGASTTSTDGSTTAADAPGPDAGTDAALLADASQAADAGAEEDEDAMVLIL